MIAIQLLRLQFWLLRTYGYRVTISTDTSVLVAVGTALTRLLALQHLAVLVNAVALALRDSMLSRIRLVLSRGPGKVVTADLNVIVSKFAELVVVHSEKLSFFRSAEVKTGDLVDDEGENGADNESVGSAGDNIGHLHVQLFVVVLDPSSGEESSVDTIKANNVAGSENAIEEKTDHSGDTVLSEHVESVINLDPELDLGGKIAYDTSHDTKDNAGPWGNETGGGGGSNETGNAA